MLYESQYGMSIWIAFKRKTFIDIYNHVKNDINERFVCKVARKKYLGHVLKLALLIESSYLTCYFKRNPRFAKTIARTKVEINVYAYIKVVFKSRHNLNVSVLMLLCAPRSWIQSHKAVMTVCSYRVEIQSINTVGWCSLFIPN